jgi:hypothetical protein
MKFEPPIIVKFKPLEWEGSEGDMTCRSAVGIYYLQKFTNGDGSDSWRWLRGEGDVYLHGKDCASEAAAKQQCEDDYRDAMRCGLEIVADTPNAIAFFAAITMRDPEVFSALFDAIGLPDTKENLGVVDNALVAVASKFEG